MAEEISATSRLQFCKLFDIDGEIYWGQRDSIETASRKDDQFHTVQDRERISYLAYKYLGDAGLWWIIADYNELMFPGELTAGTVLRIPSIATMNLVIFGG